MTTADRWRRRTRTAAVLLPVAIGVAAGGCGRGTEPHLDTAAGAPAATTAAPPPAATSGPPPAASSTPTPAPAPASTATPAATAPARLREPVDRAAAQVLLLGFGGTELSPEVAARLAAHEWGGVVLAPGNGTTAEQVAALVGQLGATAAGAGHRPPLIAALQPGGVADAVPVGPPVQATIASADGAERQARRAAGQLRDLGIRLVLAPDADVGSAGGPWEGRAFSDDHATVSAFAQAAASGWMRGGVAPAPGHFPGEGGASGDPALEPATVGLSLDELRGRDLQPFAALAARVPAMQLSAATFVAFDGVTPATLLPDAVGLLRGELGFDGVVISGDLAAASLASGESVARAAVAALAAGCDLLWIPGGAEDQEAAWRAIARAVRRGDVPKARLADALRRVDALRARYHLG
ncbi:MAG TPA: glycoside hydrolase family 3 N-terminal domain-containing protein [Baekduia sp.]|nr:glycoside hydrolase family 3 N-terminal domain-containing protein [Baekduia sp.]